MARLAAFFLPRPPLALGVGVTEFVVAAAAAAAAAAEAFEVDFELGLLLLLLEPSLDVFCFCLELLLGLPVCSLTPDVLGGVRVVVVRGGPSKFEANLAKFAPVLRPLVLEVVFGVSIGAEMPLVCSGFKIEFDDGLGLVLDGELLMLLR